MSNFFDLTNNQFFAFAQIAQGEKSEDTAAIKCLLGLDLIYRVSLGHHRVTQDILQIYAVWYEDNQERLADLGRCNFAEQERDWREKWVNGADHDSPWLTLKPKTEREFVSAVDVNILRKIAMIIEINGYYSYMSNREHKSLPRLARAGYLIESHASKRGVSRWKLTDKALKIVGESVISRGD